MDKVRHVVVQVRKSYAILRPDGLANNNLVNVIKFVPIFIPKNINNEITYYTKRHLFRVIAYIPRICIFDEGLKFGAAGNGHIQSLRREEALRVKEIEEIVIHQVCQ